MFCLRLNLVEELIITVFNFVHKAGAMMIVDIMSVSVTRARGIVVVFLISHEVVIVVSSPERLLLNMMIKWFSLVVFGIVMRDRMLISVVQGPLVFSKMRLEQRLFMAMAIIVVEGCILNVNDLIHVVVASMLESPKKFFICWGRVMHRVRVFLNFPLDTVIIVIHFMMRHDIMVLKASLKVSVIALVGGHFRKVGHVMHGKIVMSLNTKHLIIVLGSG